MNTKNRATVTLLITVLAAALITSSCGPPAPPKYTTKPIEEAESVCIRVTQVYPGNEEHQPLPLKEIMEEVLTAAGVNVVEANCDVTVTFEFELSVKYTTIVDQFNHPTGESFRCVSGGTVSGSMKFDKFEMTLSATIPTKKGIINICSDVEKALEMIEYRAAMVGLREGWVRWKPGVLIAALQHDNFKVNKAMAESLYSKSFLDDYTDEQKIEVYDSFIVAASHGGGGLLKNTLVIIMALNNIIEPEVFEEWDEEEGWKEFIELFEIETENVP